MKKWMKKWTNKLTKKQWAFLISGVVSFLVFLILTGTSSMLANRPYAQKMVRRWSDEKETAQISAFLSQNAALTVDNILEFEHNLDKALEEASITGDSERASARLWVDAYSASGRITLSSRNGSLEGDALGVGGDYFQFHPLKLLYGAYFSGEDLMQDHIIIDEDAAWKLFGSNDVVGQYVTVAGVPHMISGVVERENDSMARKAGVNSTIIYVSYDSLDKYGTHSGISCYEILMPNPVKKYAFNYVSEHLGVEESESKVIENSHRFGLAEKFRILGSFPTRSMNEKAIIYPFWENIARGYEDMVSLLLVFEILFLTYPVLLVVILLVRLWRRRTWHIKDIKNFLIDRKDRYRENRRKNKIKKGEKAL